MSNSILTQLTNNPSFAGNGVAYIDSGDGAVTGQFYGIQVITDTVLSAVSMDSKSSGPANLIGPTLPGGSYLPGLFTGVTVSSGVVALLKL